MQYSKLSDCKLFIEGSRIEIWYSKDFASNEPFDRNNPEKSHFLIGAIGGFADPRKGLSRNSILSGLWVAMQGENWSPNGEARTLIQNMAKQCNFAHTSMSVGDIVRIVEPTHDEWFMVKPIGWKSVG